MQKFILIANWRTMKIFLKKINGGMFPVYTSDHENYDKLKDGIYCASVEPGRNVKLFKKFWSLCKLILDNCENFHDVEEVSDYMKLKTNLVDYREVVNIDGQQVVRIKTKSIAWQNMKPEEFEQNFWPKFEPIACQLLNCTPEDIDKNLVF